MHIFLKNVHKFFVSGLHINKCHINSGNHHILCGGIPEIKNIVDHLLFFPFDNTVFLTGIYHGTKFMLRDRSLSGIGINAKDKKNSTCQLSNNKNNRCENGHQPVDRSCISKGQSVCLKGCNGFWCDLTKKKYKQSHHTGSYTDIHIS